MNNPGGDYDTLCSGCCWRGQNGKCIHILAYEASPIAFMQYASQEFMRTAKDSPCGPSAKLSYDKESK